MKNKYEVLFDKILIGHTFEGDLALDYLSFRTFLDEDLKGMSKEDLILIFTKAIVTLKIEISNNTKLTNEVVSVNIKAQLATEYANLQTNTLSQLIKVLPALKKKSRLSIPTLGGNARVKGDKKWQIMETIVDTYVRKIASGYHFERDGKPILGRLQEFYDDMAREHPEVDVISIGNRIRKYRKQNKSS